MKLLELFKGTGSINKVAKRYNYNVVSLDFEEKYKPDILIDILKWDYKKYSQDNKYIPDYIWASPPCQSFSPMVYKLHERNPDTAEPYSERAKLGTKILYKTLEIINYFKGKNPQLLYCIENPHGMMNKDPRMKKLPYMFTTLYCYYGDKRQKRTDFWSNYPLNLKNDKPVCHGSVQVQGLSDMNFKYRIPPRLVKQIIYTDVNNYKKAIYKNDSEKKNKNWRNQIVK